MKETQNLPFLAPFASSPFVQTASSDPPFLHNMEEKESTVSASPDGPDSASDSPPPLSAAVVGGGGVVVPLQFPAPEGDPSGKKKRGRPRKYDADGNLSAAYKAAVAKKTASLSPPGFSLSPSSPPPSEYSSKRGRGKPSGSGSGSGNWQILASLGELFANTAGGDFMPHMVTVNTGEDVAGKILSFAEKGPRGVCVLSANGTVSNVTIRQPGSSGGILTYEGRFEILSLSGSFTVSDIGGTRTSRTGGLSVSLAGPDGRVVGGGIAGVLTAASPIQIVVGSFVPNGYKVHKRKYQRSENAMGSMRSSAPDTVTAARPISQVEPRHVQVQPILAPFQLQEQNHGGSEHSSDKQMSFTTSYPNATWNGSDQRPTPSPDINISVPFE